MLGTQTVRLILHDGRTLTIRAEDVSRVCENLWCLRPNPDAIVLARVLVAESRDFSLRFPIGLSAAQSALMRQAIAKPEGA